MLKFKAPWHYLIWCPPAMSAECEIALARMIRREGMFYMVRMFWGIVTQEDKFTLGCAEMLFTQNYPVVICAIGWLTGIEDLLIAGAGWLVTLVLGTARYIGWLIWLLNRWPPLARN